MKTRLIFNRGTSYNAFPISLFQTGREKFTVVYGSQRKENLDYVTAANELGLSILHCLGCEGKLNVEP